MTSIAVIDYGMGNLRSVAKALEHVAPSASIAVTANAEIIAAAERVIFPGVGALRDCMTELRRLALDQVIRELAASGKPLLGICLGMQALLDWSEENGGSAGLGILPGKVLHFAAGQTDPRTGEPLKVPHMGWNQVHHSGGHPLWRDIPQDSRFYFVHSYYARPDNSADCVGTTHYGLDFASVLARKNVFAAQFHPEKSQQAGLTLLRNFAEWNGTL
ncbi:imidazole glycerol phosphate synthase subunit HisH [Candidatus Tenderia electrophaga]|jgi:glutamine amidotransferase|uniref:Imidazole glycerol phosphate synthase subunit HisH n=1 Tax=Candidatus Tenderia electrophaga TaxID=1748243 RepID=A0A0S2THH8_9GAMM|nr:imidazole glycerol phosphate synthase subunit HisH [Candidatus Tenderia electrophaga]